MPKTQFKPAIHPLLKERMRVLVTGVPSLKEFNNSIYAKAAWEKIFLGCIVTVCEIEEYKDGLVRIQLDDDRFGSYDTYVHKGCLLDIGVRV